MKKIITLIAILALVAVIFTLAACGNKTDGSLSSEMTTLKDEVTTAMDDISSALDELDDDLTENGNVTDQDSSTGLFEDATSDNKEITTPAVENNTETTAVTNAAQ